MIYISPKNLSRKPGGGIEIYLYSLFNFGDRWGGWSTPSSGRFTPGKDPVRIVQEAGLPQGRYAREWKN